MNIFVTGSAGFIASNLIERLRKDGHNVIMCDMKYTLSMTNLFGEYLISARKINSLGFDFQKLEIIQPEEYEPLEKIDFVFHLGAISDTTYTNREEITFCNYDFSINLFKYCKENKIPLVYASSAATYGDGKNGFSDYSMPSDLKPLNLYAETKNNFDKYVLENQISSLCVGLKFFNVYGKYEYLKKYTMSSLIHKAINEITKTGKLQLFEFGQQKRDFVFVDDIVDVMCWFMNQNNSKNGIYNVGTGESKSFNDLGHAIFDAMEKPFCIKYIKMPEKLKGKYQDFTEADISKLRKAGYSKNFTTLKDGAKHTWDFYKHKNMDFEKMELDKFKSHDG